MADRLFHKVVRNSDDLVTDPRKTTQGFIVQATEKMRRATSIVEDALGVQRKLERVRSIDEVLRDASLTSVVLSCAGLSTKAQGHLSKRQLKDIARAAWKISLLLKATWDVKCCFVTC